MKDRTAQATPPSKYLHPLPPLALVRRKAQDYHVVPVTRLELLRHERWLQQKQLADMAGLTRERYLKIELKHPNKYGEPTLPTPEELTAIVQALNVMGERLGLKPVRPSDLQMATDRFGNVPGRRKMLKMTA